VSRRSFLKYAALGGVAAWGVYSGIVYPSGWARWMTYGQKPWELATGVVDYAKVAEHEGAMDAFGVPRFYREGSEDRRKLNVAQWYDYWPGKVIRDFGVYMAERFNLPGCEARWTSNIYTSNEELFTWISQTGRKFDVMVPTNYTVETMEKAGLIVNMNREWVPNFDCMFGPVPSSVDHIDVWRPNPFVTTYPSWPNGYNTEAGFDFRTPALNGYMYRMNRDTYPNPRGTDNFTWDETNSLLAVPFQWGTTGIGYRTDVFEREDIERYGWDVLELPEYHNPRTGTTYNLHKKKMMLDDMREVYTAAFKDVGWKRQVDEGLTPTAVTRSNGDYQWSSNETTEERLQAATDWLVSFKGDTWGFNTPQQGPWLVAKQMLVDQAWSGDIMYAVRPNSNQHLPVEYFVPKQGGARWIDNMVIHRECEKLWLAHQFINYIQDPVVQADVSAWNLYATPNAWSFEILHDDPSYAFRGRNLDGTPYYWNPAEDSRIYGDFAIGYSGPEILSRCEYQKDVGVRATLRYFKHWRSVKF